MTRTNDQVQRSYIGAIWRTRVNNVCGLIDTAIRPTLRSNFFPAYWGSLQHRIRLACGRCEGRQQDGVSDDGNT